ncbi:hypothetical protein HNY73_005939 [Argiope bruennichi]|uniref:Uncharacterized protein n=1 Tax=Argiope bruennichi TaxID=94029 RepID=A0A8T0FJ19_ARGBR|nr:hypothetical protein HNY73_005939 [Argiope bruennichi]
MGYDIRLIQKQGTSPQGMSPHCANQNDTQRLHPTLFVERFHPSEASVLQLISILDSMLYSYFLRDMTLIWNPYKGYQRQEVVTPDSPCYNKRKAMAYQFLTLPGLRYKDRQK